MNGIATLGAVLLASAALSGACGGSKTKPEAPVTVVTFGTPAANEDDTEKPAARAQSTATQSAAPEPVSVAPDSAGSAKTATQSDEEASGNEIDLDALPKRQIPAETPAPKHAGVKARGKQRASKGTSRQKSTAADDSPAEPPADSKSAGTKSPDPKSPDPKSPDPKSPDPKSPDPKSPDPKGAETSPASSYSGPDPCQTAHFSVAAVREACAAGGRSKAKGVMKRAVQKALAFGTSLRCNDCHVDQSSYALKADAVARLRRWLEN